MEMETNLDIDGPLVEAAKAAGLNPHTLLASLPTTRGDSVEEPPLRPTYDGDLSPSEADCLTPFLVLEMKTRGRVSAVDCLNSLIWFIRRD